MTDPGRLSVPAYAREPSREPSREERHALHRVADALIPAHGELPSPSALDGFDHWLDRALAARDDALDEIFDDADRFAGLEEAKLRQALAAFSEESPERFRVLASVVAGAYLMVPEVRQAIGYPGQRRHPPQFDEAANQIMDGILDPVIARGPVYTPVPPGITD